MFLSRKSPVKQKANKGQSKSLLKSNQNLPGSMRNWLWVLPETIFKIKKQQA